MGPYSLVPEGGSAKAPWLLEWNDERFVIRGATGAPILETQTASAHKLVDLSQTFIDGTICISGPSEVFRFKQNSAAEAALRTLLDAAMARDPVYCAEMRTRSIRAMTVGPVMFLVAGGLFGGYCWYAIGAPDPPADHWIHYVGWLIKGVLLVLLAVALAGLGMAFSGFFQWRRIRRIERQMQRVEE